MSGGRKTKRKTERGTFLSGVAEVGGDLVEGVVDIGGAVVDGLGSAADAVGDVAGSAAEGMGGCLEGCAGCSAVIVLMAIPCVGLLGWGAFVLIA